MNIFTYFIQIKSVKNLSILVFLCFIFSLSVSAQQYYDFKNDDVTQKRFDSIKVFLAEKNVNTYFEALQKISVLESDLIEKKNYNSLFNLYLNLNSYHSVNRDVSNSKKCLDKMKSLLEKLNKKVFYGLYYESLAIYFSIKNDTVSRKKYFYLSSHYLSKYGSDSQKADMYYNLTMLNCDGKNWDQVILYGKKADSINVNVKKKNSSVFLLMFLTEAYLNKNDLKNASFYLNRININGPERINETILKKYKIETNYHRVNGLFYELSGNPKKANESYKLGLYYSKLLNSTFSNVLNEKLELESTTVINELLLQKKLRESELENKNYHYQKIIIVLATLIIISLLVILVLQYKRSKSKSKFNRLLLGKNKELIEAISIKNRFFNSITHELRTPLNAITGGLYLLKEKYAKEEQETFAILDNSTSYLLKISNQIIEYNLMNAETEKALRLDEINLKSIIENLTNTFNTLNNNQNSISLNFDDKIASSLIFDEVKITMVLNNIIDNAIKFTKKGKVDISIHLIEESVKFQKIKFKISDTGIGISEENVTKIFELFRQGSDEISITYGGSGIGLAIAKKILDIYDSEIIISSQLNVGTTVEFDLEFGKSNSNNSKKVALELLRPNRNKVKILLVEDNKINQLLTQKILLNNGYECDIVENGFLAVERVKENEYSLILMDIMMPIMDGFEASKIISELKPMIPIVALTAVSINVNEGKFVNSKIKKVLNKPLNVVELIKTIQTYT